MSKLEKFILVGLPWIFGMIMIMGGVIMWGVSKQPSISLFFIFSGILCMCFYCVCALLAKIVESSQPPSKDI